MRRVAFACSIVASSGAQTTSVTRASLMAGTLACANLARSTCGGGERMQRFVTDENRKWWTLGAVSVGLFMIMLDNTIVNVALPSIRRDLGMSLESLEWIVAGYALTFAAFMLTGGKLADFLGRRLIFMAGLVVLTGASPARGL